MKNRENSSFDVQDVLWLLVVAVNLSNLPFSVFKLNWTLKKRSELLGDWGDLQRGTVSRLAVLRCSVYFIQDRVSDLQGKKTHSYKHLPTQIRFPSGRERVDSRVKTHSLSP